MDAALKQAGHIPGRYFDPTNDRDLTEGIYSGNSAPRFSTGYGDLRHVPAVLLETHSSNPTASACSAPMWFIESALRSVGEHGTELRAAIAADRNRPAGQDPRQLGQR